jgi:hypothetical protein
MTDREKARAAWKDAHTHPPGETHVPGFPVPMPPAPKFGDPEAKAAKERLQRVLTEDHVTKAEFDNLAARVRDLEEKHV